MDLDTFRAYLDAYNAGDWTAVGAYYTSDIRFESFGNTYVGPEVLEFLKRLHSGVRDQLTIRTLSQDGNRISLESEAVLHALVDLPQLPAGPMRAGETRTMPMNVDYVTRGDQICTIIVRGEAQRAGA
jgi:hypothetical protein